MRNSKSLTMFRSFIGFVAAVAWCASTNGIAMAQDRPRLIVLTDFFKDPDDKQSMIRLLSFANEFEIEGLIATSLAFGNGEVSPERILQTIDDYGQVVDNLKQHESDGRAYPSADYLKSIVKAGAPVIRKPAGASNQGFPVPYPPGANDSRSCDPAEKWIGQGKDTEASEHIIKVVDRDDSRPIWVTIWGGAMDLGQALWKVRAQRTPEEVDRFVSKLRVYQISWQDTGAVWIWNNFPNLFLIQSADSHRGIYRQGSAQFRDDQWIAANIREGHGPLGAGYLQAGRIDGIKEGDSPSFLHLLASGLSDPERPEWGGWGGRFVKLDDERRFYVPAFDVHPTSSEAEMKREWAVGRWNEATSHAFAARMDWGVEAYEHANHAPIVHLNGDAKRYVLQCEIEAGQTMSLDASGTKDPDGDALRYRWFQYREAGTYQDAIDIFNAENAIASFVAPQVHQPQTAHIVLMVVDEGQPPLTSYRRLIVSIHP